MTTAQDYTTSIQCCILQQPVLKLIHGTKIKDGGLATTGVDVYMGLQQG